MKPCLGSVPRFKELPCHNSSVKMPKKQMTPIVLKSFLSEIGRWSVYLHPPDFRPLPRVWSYSAELRTAFRILPNSRQWLSWIRFLLLAPLEQSAFTPLLTDSIRKLVGCNLPVLTTSMFLLVAYLENSAAPCFIHQFARDLRSTITFCSADSAFVIKDSQYCSSLKRGDWLLSLRYCPNWRSCVYQNGHSYSVPNSGCDTMDFPPQRLVKMRGFCYRYDFEVWQLLHSTKRSVSGGYYLCRQLSEVAIDGLLLPCDSLEFHLPWASLLASLCLVSYL